MADAYPHALLVEFDPNKVPKLKNKLTKYFQSKRLSGGGDCTVEHDSGSPTAVLRFRAQQDQRSVLEKESHLLSLETGHLRLRVQLMSQGQDSPTDKNGSEQTSPPDRPSTSVHSRSPRCGNDEGESLPASLPSSSAPSLGPSTTDAPLSTASVLGPSTSTDPPLSTASVLGNLSADLLQEFVEMLVENIMKRSASEGITVEMIPALKSAVVSFKTGPENAEFLQRSPVNRTFKSKALTVRPLDPPTQVLVEEAGLDEDILSLVFDKEGAEMEKVEVNSERQTTVISFTSAADVQRLLQKPLVLKRKELKLYPFYQSLGRALYGSDRPPLKLPPTVVHPADQALLRFFHIRLSVLQTLHAQLKSHWCQAELSQDAVRLVPEPVLLQQEEKVLGEWTTTVRSVLSQFLSQFEVCKLTPPPDLWKNSLEKVSALLTSQPQVLMVPEETNGVIKVVGPQPDIFKLREPLCECVNSLIKRVRREKALVTEQIKVPMSVFNLLSQDGLQQKLLSVYPEIKFDSRGPFPKITGLTEEIANTNKVIYEEMLVLKRQNVDVDRYVLEFLKEEEQQERMNGTLSQQNAVFEVTGNRIQLLACTDKDLNKAETYLKSLLISQYVKAEDSNVLKTIEWQQLVDQIEKEDNKRGKNVQIRTEDDQVVVSGFNDNVASASYELDNFLKQNAHVQESVVVNPVGKLEYLQQFAKSNLDALEGKVAVAFSKDGLSLSGSRANVKDCVGLAKELIDSVAFESLTIAKHGARKVFEDKDENYQAAIASKTGCLVKIVDAADAKQGISLAGSFPKPVYMVQTPDGVEIFVANADMCSYPVHAIVNPAKEDLQLNSGLAAALLKAAGQQLQVECDRLYVMTGNLSPGECVVTNAGGNLVCRKIIHVVGPRYDKQNVVKAHELLKHAVKQTLEQAEKQKCESLAIPAVSRNRNFPLRECAQAVVAAVREYCGDRFREFCLKSVHFVNNDDAAVAAMVDAVKQEFGDRGISHKMAAVVAATPPPPAAAPKHQAAASSSSARTAPAPVPVDPNCVGKELTKEGLEICILKGHLEKATTDVIVNTVTTDLVLSRGAVSNAVLSAAGPSLQTMVQAKQSQASVGDLIVTEGANLSCHTVYHAVAPHYDNGQGTAQKQLSGVFRDCLSKAESSGMTSISFSAMGTGNLGFPRDLVWTLLMDSVLEISSKKPKNLKRVQVVLFPRDAQTIQVFSDEFQKKFPKAGGSSTAAAAPSGGPFSKVVSSSSSHETKLNGVTVKVLTGDITKETTDVIVNSSNEKFSLKSGVSKAILEAAGPAVENECQTLGSQPNDGMILTQPGNLQCKKILHLVGQTDLAKIRASVRGALLRCIKNNLSSVAFPAIGTGQGNVGARAVADSMLDAMIEVLTQNQNSSLKAVRVVIFQAPMLKDFHDSLQQRTASDAKEKDKDKDKEKDKAKESGMLGTLASKFKSFFVAPAPQQTSPPDDFVLEPVKPAPLCFHIFGESVLKITAAKKKIDSILSKSLQSLPIKDETVLSLTPEDHRRLADIQRSAGVGIRIESTNGEGTISIDGLAKDVLAVSVQIHDILKAARQEEDLNQKAALLSAVVEWQFAQSGQDFQSFDAKTGYELEQALERKLKEVKVKLNGQEFTVKMPRGPATSCSGTSLTIQRFNKMSDLPESWETMDTSSTKSLPVKSGSAEYISVEKQFKASCNRTITKIERIQNPVLWQSLQIKRRAMDQKNGHSNNERRLFHGTSADTVAFINEHGFNRSYAGKNATAYGKGTYFAVNAHYSSSNTYSQPNANGDKFMYLCSVLTGDFTTGAQGMIDAPLKKSSSIDRYDSVVDNTSNPSMFIIFHDSHAYPEYLITFR